MAKHRSFLPRWLRHRSLVTAEALLLVGAAREFATQRVTPSLPGWGKVVFTMAATVGLFGGLFYLINRVTAKSVARTHDIVRAAPLPAPTLIAHAAAFACLFLLYAYLMGVRVLPAWAGFSA